MIRSFRSKDAETLFHDAPVRRFQAFERPARRTLLYLHRARVLEDLKAPPGKYFGTPPEIWLDLQSDYELRAARQTTWTRVEPTVQTRVA